MRLKKRREISFSFYAIDKNIDPDIVIDLNGNIEFTPQPEPRLRTSVLVMVGGWGPSADQLTAMARLQKGSGGAYYSGQAMTFATSVSAIRSLLPESEAISLEP